MIPDFKKPFKSGWSDQSGSALIGALISAGIISVVLAASSQMMVNLLRAGRQLEIKGDKESVRRTLLDKVSCDATFSGKTPGSCAGNFIDVKGRQADGTEFELISKSGTKYGPWTYRAECDAQDGIIVKAALAKNMSALKSKNPKDFHPDPLTSIVHTWDDEKSLLYAKGTTLCGNGLKPVRIVSGTYQGQCGALTWLFCSKTQEIILGGKPTQVQIYNINDQAGVNLAPFNSIKFESMKADNGWQSVTNFSGMNAFQGPILDHFYSAVKMTDKGFMVRKALNIEFKSGLGFLSTSYHYVAFIEQ